MVRGGVVQQNEWKGFAGEFSPWVQVKIAEVYKSQTCLEKQVYIAKHQKKDGQFIGG